MPVLYYNGTGLTYFVAGYTSTSVADGLMSRASFFSLTKVCRGSRPLNTTTAMNLFKKVRTLKCVAEFTQAIEVLGKTVWEIEQMYHTSLPILFESEQLMVEIESELATVCCLLDKNLRCSSSYLFCTDDNDLTECVAYCKSNYKRTGIQSWVTASCIIRYIHDKEFCLLFSPKERKYNNEVVS